MKLITLDNTAVEKVLMTAVVVVSCFLSFLITMNIPSEAVTIVGYVSLFFGIAMVIGALITFVCGLFIDSKLLEGE